MWEAPLPCGWRWRLDTSTRLPTAGFLPPVSLQPSGDSITLSESTAIISHGTTGLVTWDAALYLAEWAIENPAAFRHR